MEDKGKLPIPALRQTAYTIKHAKRRKTEEQKQEDKKKRQDLLKTRVYIGDAFDRWRQIKTITDVKSDGELAVLLLDSYEEHHLKSPQDSPRGKSPPPPASPSSTSGTSPEREEEDDPFAHVQQLEEYFSSEEAPHPQEEASMPSTDFNEVFDVDEFNSLHNATIDWEDNTRLPEMEDGSLSPSEEDFTREVDSEEEDDLVPRICVNSGGALKSKMNIDHFPEVSVEETVLDVGEDDPDHIAAPDPATDIPIEDDIIGHPAYIAYDMSLHQLVDHLELPDEVCEVFNPKTKRKCGDTKPFHVRITSRGTAAVVEWICVRGHTVWKWTSQPYVNVGMPVGDFLLSCNLLLSGNNYAQIALLFKFMNMGMVNKTTFHKIQGLYCIDTIKDAYNQKRREIITRLKKKASVVALGDGRMDRPGSDAQYCTYSTMDNDSKEVISVVNMYKRQTARSSVAMERQAFIRTLDTLRQEVKLSEFCTDADVHISSLFSKGKYKDSGVHHSFDMWHGSKNLFKKIHAVGRLKDCTILHEWNRDICNHFWYCCKMADDYDTFFDMWTALLHHVTGQQSRVFGACEQSPLTEIKDKPLIKKASIAHQKLAEIVLNERWLNSVKKYLTFRSTAELESYHNHILMYAGKRFGFSPPVYEARVLLAALDYNHHLDRTPKKTSSGEYQYRKLFNKKSRRWTLQVLKEKKDYSYVPALQKAVLLKSLSSDVQQLLMCKEEQQEWSCGLDQEDYDDPPELPHIKEEQEEVWMDPEREQLPGLEESDIMKFTLTSVKSGDDDDDEEEEKPQSSQLYQSWTENRDAPDRNSDPHSYLEPVGDDDETSGSSETDVSDDDWTEPREPQCAENDAEKESFICSECGKTFGLKTNLKRHAKCHTGEKPFSCAFCAKGFNRREHLIAHMRCHSGEKPFSCSVCNTSFSHGWSLEKHMRVHTGEKPFCCSFCSKSFRQRSDLSAHFRIHTGEKPFSCSLCNTSFTQRHTLVQHMRTHTGLKPFDCSVCGKRFSRKGHLKRHVMAHNGEKPFNCAVCDKGFTWQSQFKRHECSGESSVKE